MTTQPTAKARGRYAAKFDPKRMLLMINSLMKMHPADINYLFERVLYEIKKENEAEARLRMDVDNRLRKRKRVVSVRKRDKGSPVKGRKAKP